jgi:hypothetical protein
MRRQESDTKNMGKIRELGGTQNQPKDKVLAQTLKHLKGEGKGFMVRESSENKKRDQ